MTTLTAWFLSPDDRGNPATEIDRRRGGGVAYTVGNDVTVLVHGRSYYRRLLATLRDLQAGCWLHFTDWRGDPDERLDGPGTEVAGVLADLARRGVHVRGLVWRSHPDEAHFSEQENLHLVETVNGAGGEVLLDERVRRDGSHHQKLFVIRHRDDARPGRGLRRWDRPVPRPPRRRAPRGRRAGHRSRSALRAATPVA